jgi:hypothetical protein
MTGFALGEYWHKKYAVSTSMRNAERVKMLSKRILLKNNKVKVRRSKVEAIPETLIIETVNRLASKPMTTFSQGFRDASEKIITAALSNANSYTHFSKLHPAVALMDVVLAANRNYRRQVEEHIKRMREQFVDLTLSELKMKVKTNDYKSFKQIWGHADEKKFLTLKSILEAVFEQANPKSKDEDFEVLRDWADKSDLHRRLSDPIGRLPNVGIATFQHLRMTFGINTVKPDQRVMEVLQKEFGLKLSQLDSIFAVEHIAKVTGYKVLEVDQIFVKYGSGYYPASQREVKQEVENIIKVLLEEDVPVNIISKATKWTAEQISQMKL